MRVCANCKKEKGIDEFYVGKDRKDGLFSYCKICCRLRQKKYKEYKRKYQAKYRKENPNKITEWREKNKDKLRIYERQQYYKNPAKYMLNVKKRKLRLMGIIGSYSSQEWEDLKYIYDYKCFGCGIKESEKKLTPDHVVAIAMNGTNYITNIIPLCGSCNSSKGKKSDKWYIDKWLNLTRKEDK